MLKNNVLIAICSETGNLYKVNLRVITPEKMCFVVSKNNSIRLWHERICHQNKRHVREILKTVGIDITLGDQFCEGCALGKQHRNPFHKRVDRAKEAREIIHADLCPLEIESLGKKRYFLLFKDDYSSFRKIYFLRQKSETFSRNVKEIVSDGGREFVNDVNKKFLESEGIKHSVAIPYTLQQNGVVERENRTIVEAVQSMLYSNAAMPRFLWAEAANTAVYVLNKTGPTKIQGKTPGELWGDKTASIDHLKVFGTE